MFLYILRNKTFLAAAYINWIYFRQLSAEDIIIALGLGQCL